MNNNSKDMKRWMNLASRMVEESTPEEEKAKERERAIGKLHGDLSKTNKDLMKMKENKLNLLIKKKYYDSGAEVGESDMFSFHFTETSGGYEFHMPLNILFGRRTQAFCAQYWDDFFRGAGIETEFAGNIKEALEKAGNINLVMTLSKDMEEELPDAADTKADEEAEEEHGSESESPDFDIEDDEGQVPDETEEFGLDTKSESRRRRHGKSINEMFGDDDDDDYDPDKDYGKERGEYSRATQYSDDEEWDPVICPKCNIGNVDLDENGEMSCDECDFTDGYSRKYKLTPEQRRHIEG